MSEETAYIVTHAHHEPALGTAMAYSDIDNSGNDRCVFQDYEDAAAFKEALESVLGAKFTVHRIEIRYGTSRKG